MEELDPDKLNINEILENWRKKRKLLYYAGFLITGITLGFIISFTLDSPTASASTTISIDTIAITLDVAFVSFVTSWISSQWGMISSLIDENNFNNLRTLIGRVIKVVDPNMYEEYLRYKAERNHKKKDEDLEQK